MRTNSEKREFFSKVAETSPVCIVKTDKNGYFVYANRVAKNVQGLSANEAQGRPYNDIIWNITDINGNHYPEEKLPFKIIQKYRKPFYDIKHYVNVPNGQKKLLSINAEPIFDENGLFDGMVATIEDITETSEKDKKLKESEQKFHSYVDNSPIGIFVANEYGNYVDVNPAATRIKRNNAESQQF